MPLTRGNLWDWLNRGASVGDVGQFYNFLKGLWSERLDSCFDDYLVGGLELGFGANAPDLVEIRDGLFMRGFDGAGVTTEQAFFTLHLLHGIKPGTTPTFHIHWTHNNGSPTGDVKWFIDYSYSHGYSAGTFPAPTTVNTVQTAAAQYTHHITDDDDMPVSLSSFEPDGVLICRVYRNPADSEDTFGDDAMLLQVDMHYERDRMGSSERNRPFAGY